MGNLTAAQAANLLRVDADTIDARLAPVVLRGVLDIKDDARRILQRANDKRQRGPFVANLVTADMTSDPLTGEVGYTGQDYEPVARAFEYGTAHTPPLRALNTATDTEADQFARACGRVTRKPPRT